MAETALDQEPVVVDVPETELQVEDHLDPVVEETESTEVVDQGEPISDVNTLVEHLEADPEWFEGLKVSATVNGAPANPTIKELVDSYQIQSAATQILDEAKQKRQLINQEIAQQQENAKAQIGEAAGLAVLAEKLFMHDLQQANLNELRDTDFDQYQRVKDTFEQRQQALQATKAQISQSLNAVINPEPLTEEQVMEVRSQIEAELPDMASEEARAQLAEYALSVGYTRDELAINADPRLFVLGEKARRWDELQSKQQAAKKKVANIPKVMKPGALTTGSKPESNDPAEILYG